MTQKTLVLYVFHEYTSLVQNFIDKCLFQSPIVDFLFIAHGFKEKLNLPRYVSILYKEKNEGYDFSAWSYGLLINNKYENYENFIFVNSTVYGPFINNQFQGKWTDIFINRLTNDIKLFGCTINTKIKFLTDSHVQSYLFSMKKDTLKLLIKNNIFSLNIKDHYLYHDDVIKNKEIKMSRIVIDNGGNIGCLYKFYNGIDFRKKDNFPFEYFRLNSMNADDIMFPEYLNVAWTLDEVVFIKGNRFDIK